MCGIYLTNNSISKKEVKSNLETIQFRGPDYTGVMEQNGLLFGHLRLSIIDLDKRSNQPFVFEDLIIVFNGEIYNFLDVKLELQELGHSFETTCDTEVVIKGYKQWGEGVVHKLNGMFAFAIYDSTANSIFCSRDRLGVKPFYYSWNDGKFEICSQLKPISKNKSINQDAIAMYFDCKYIPSPYTIYKEVHKLAPGKNLIINLENNTFEIKEYWNLKNVQTSSDSYDESVQKLHDLLKDAVKIRLQSDVPIGSFLSGGVDSALVSSIASEVSNKTIKTFTIGFDNPKYDESKIAESFADIIGTNHKTTICTPEDIINLIPKLLEVYDEPFADSSALPSLLLNKVTKKDITVALSGDGGDESFLGYNYFDLVSKYKLIFMVPLFVRRLISFLLPKKVLGFNMVRRKKELLFNSIDNIIEGVFVGFGFDSIVANRDLSWLRPYSGYKKWSKNILQRCADLNIKLWLENDSNVKVDRASMAYSVEVRSPFLDYRIVEFARSLPVSFRYSKNNNSRKKILRDILKNYLPEEKFNQPKSGFSIPLGDWIKNELLDEFSINLTDSLLEQIPRLNVKKFKNMFNDHISGNGDYSTFIWRVYLISKWLQKSGYIKN